MFSDSQCHFSILFLKKQVFLHNWNISVNFLKIMKSLCNNTGVLLHKFGEMLQRGVKWIAPSVHELLSMITWIDTSCHELQINLHEGYDGHAIRRQSFIFGVPSRHALPSTVVYQLIFYTSYRVINCRRQYHCEAISLAVQISLAVRRIKLPSLTPLPYYFALHGPGE